MKATGSRKLDMILDSIDAVDREVELVQEALAGPGGLQANLRHALAILDEHRRILDAINTHLRIRRGKPTT